MKDPNELPSGHVDRTRQLEAEKRIARAKARGVHWTPPSDKIDKSKTDGEETDPPRPHRPGVDKG